MRFKRKLINYCHDLTDPKSEPTQVAVILLSEDGKSRFLVTLPGLYTIEQTNPITKRFIRFLDCYMSGVFEQINAQLPGATHKQVIEGFQLYFLQSNFYLSDY
jgi:hypothetical protein